jgi:hypothetical protein
MVAPVKVFPRPKGVLTQKCRREGCGLTYDEHVNGFCLNDPERTFLHHQPRVAASQSFAEDEVRVLEAIFNGLMRGAGGDLQNVTRWGGFAKVARKVGTMRKKIAQSKVDRT